jgi:hypothetical protein
MQQLRVYRVREGAMDQFVAEWRQRIVPLRRRHGFTVAGAWKDPDDRTFVWIVGHDGDFEAADRRYYDAPERQAMDPPPTRHLESVDTRLLEPVDVPEGDAADDSLAP